MPLKDCLEAKTNHEARLCAFFAGVGLFAGAASAMAIGGSIQWLLRRIGIGFIAAISVATLVNVLTPWLITDFLQTKYPGLRAGRAEKPPATRLQGRSPLLTRATTRILVWRPLQQIRESVPAGTLNAVNMPKWR